MKSPPTQSRTVIQKNVKVDDSKAAVLDVAPSDKMSDIVAAGVAASVTCTCRLEEEC